VLRFSFVSLQVLLFRLTAFVLVNPCAGRVVSKIMEEVEISAHDFLIVNGLIVIIIALSFALIRRSPRAPIKLKLNERSQAAGESAPSPQSKASPQTKTPPLTKSSPLSAVDPAPQAGSGRPPGWDNYRPRANKIYESVSQRPSSPPPSRAPSPPPREKVLNVMFNWNGHTWDAYEVLGIPAGSSREAAQAAYQRVSAQCDSESLPFLKAALEAIQRS
jgi:hypothetical protein